MISGFVVSHNRAEILETCLRSIRFVDELIVIDKSSSDHSPTIAKRYADRVVTQPWSPTAEETRGLGLLECKGDFIVFLDDDECFSPEAIRYLSNEGRAPSADAYLIPVRQHILGVHDERAYYWPARALRAFCKGSVKFNSTLHGGINILSHNIASPPFESGICYHNISHPDSHCWIGKTNFYTSIHNRAVLARQSDASLIDTARQSIEEYAARVPKDGDQYLEAVAMLRAIYDIVDAIKAWEQREGINGQQRFAEFCSELQVSYDELQRKFGLRTC